MAKKDSKSNQDKSIPEKKVKEEKVESETLVIDLKSAKPKKTKTSDKISYSKARENRRTGRI